MSKEDKSQLLNLLRAHSFVRREVTLASGAKSDWFIDCKQTVLTALGHRLVGEVLLGCVRNSYPRAQVVAGVALGGCPLASAVSLTSLVGHFSSEGHTERGNAAALDAFYVRKQVKSHGSTRAIEGDDGYPDGATLVVLEDVVTSGGSTLQAVDTLRQAGHNVLGVIALVDREAGGEAALRSAGLGFEALFTRDDFFDAAAAKGAGCA